MKTDKNLGLRVHRHLVQQGVETPKTDTVYAKAGTQYEEIAKSTRHILNVLGLDLNDDSLKDTPDRVATMYMTQIFSGLNYSNFPKCTTVENKMKYDEIVAVRKINMQTVCEHHLALIDGFVKIAYIPHKSVLGLSKFNRVVKFFASRPQIQERLTEQIYHALSFILRTEDVAVVITATHYCVKMRGVEDQSSDTTTSKLGGKFRLPEVRNEFFNL